MDLTDSNMKRYRSQNLIFLLLLLFLFSMLLPPGVEAESLAVFPLSNAVVRRRGSTLNVFCKISSTVADRKASNEDLTWLFLPLKERRRGSREPRVKFSDTRTAILRHDDATSELRIAPLELEDAGHYACASHWNSPVSLGDQIRLDVFVDSGNRSYCDPSEFRCSTGECLPSGFRCDRFDNCPDGSDEDGCGDPCFDDLGFLCRNDRCLDRRLRCDRMHGNNCGDWSDEAGCDFEAAAATLTRRTEDESEEEEEIDDELAASRKELADYRLTLYVAIGCVAGLVFLLLASYCVAQLGRNEERAAIATVEAFSGGRGGRGGGGKGRSVEMSSSDRFVNMRKLDEIMEGIEKEELTECLSQNEARRRSWIIVDGEEEDEDEEKYDDGGNVLLEDVNETETPSVSIDPFLNDASRSVSYNPGNPDDKPRRSILALRASGEVDAPSLSTSPFPNATSRNVSFDPKKLDSLTRITSIITPDSGKIDSDESPLDDDVFELRSTKSTPPTE